MVTKLTDVWLKKWLQAWLLITSYRGSDVSNAQ